jgi:hypothetical protein
VDSKTQRRGSADTSGGRFAKLLVVSVLLHVPLTPWAALVGLLSLWSPPAESVDAPPITGIPIDLIEDEPPSASAPEPAAAVAEPASAGEPVVVKKPHKKPDPAKIVDAGAPDAEVADADVDAAVDAGLADAGKLSNDAGLADAGAVADAKDAAPADAGPSTTDAGAKPLSDPSVVAGVKRVADPNANVRITLYTEKNPRQSAGQADRRAARFALSVARTSLGQPGSIRSRTSIRFISSVRSSGTRATSWRFFGITCLPPKCTPRSICWCALTNRASGSMPACLSRAHMPTAPSGASSSPTRRPWSSPHQAPMRPPLPPASNCTLRPSKGSEAALIYLATPSRAFLGLAINVPNSIKWARVRITPTAEGGATAEVDAEDENADTARENAAYLTRTTNALSQLNLGFLGSLLGQSSHRFIEHVGFTSEGKMIHGSASVTADQLQTALDMAGAFLSDRSTRRRARPAGSGAAASGVPSSVGPELSVRVFRDAVQHRVCADRIERTHAQAFAALRNDYDPAFASRAVRSGREQEIQAQANDDASDGHAEQGAATRPGRAPPSTIKPTPK